MPRPDRFAAPLLSRRELLAAGSAGIVAAVAGCGANPPPDGKPEKVWGLQGTAPGRFQKPRAITIDANDQLYIVDMTARIQVFDRDGNYLRGWRTPEWQFGKPCGLDVDLEGRILVADTHYYRMLVYTKEGKLLDAKTIGGKAGTGQGEFGFLTHACQDKSGNYYISEYGENDRIQKFASDGKYLGQWGGHGSEPGKFLRPQKLSFDKQGRMWVTDVGNHRIQIFEMEANGAKLVGMWGEVGSEPGQLRYPYDIAHDGAGHVYIAEFGNSRVQKFDESGEFISSWGSWGRRAGELFNPWGLVRDSLGTTHILDTYNHRVQRVVI